jgi:hypothetical protein
VDAIQDDSSDAQWGTYVPHIVNMGITMIEVQKQTVSTNMRQLSNTWQLEQFQTPRAEMSNQVGADLAHQLQREIDDEILCQAYLAQGWHEVGYPELETYQVKDWLETNCQGKYWQGVRLCCFEQLTDAAACKLAWG